MGVNGLWKMTDTTTLSFAAGYAWNKADDDAFEAATTGFVSYEDRNVETKIPTFDVAFLSRPLKDLSVSAKYGYCKYDYSANESMYLKNDDFHDQTYSQHKLSADAVYSFGKGYSLKAWGSMLGKEYESVIEGNTEWKTGLELRKRMSSALSGKASYQYTNRTAEDWRAYGSTFNHTEIGWFPWSYAAYDEHRLRADLYTQPTESLSLGFNGSVYTRDYDKGNALETASGFGSSKGWRLGVDADWAINRDFSVFAFYAYDHQKFDRDNVTNVNLANAEKDSSHTIGVGFDVHPELRPWSFSLQYVWSIDKSKSGYLAATDHDEAEYKSHYAEAKASWRLAKSWTLEGTALYGKVDSSDYLRSGVYPSGLSENPNGTDLRESADYSAALVYVGVRYDLPM